MTRIRVDLAFTDPWDPEDPGPKVLHYSGEVPLDLVESLISAWGLEDIRSLL